VESRRRLRLDSKALELDRLTVDDKIRELLGDLEVLLLALLDGLGVCGRSQLLLLLNELEVVRRRRQRQRARPQVAGDGRGGDRGDGYSRGGNHVLLCRQVAVAYVI
jgi:hypothetical protein